jgi:hypothetical protein
MSREGNRRTNRRRTWGSIGIAAVAPAAVVSASAATSSSTYSASAGPTAYAHTHDGHTQYTILEQFGVTATQIYEHFGWKQPKNSGVSSGDFLDGYCYHSSFPGWNIRDCTVGSTLAGKGDLSTSMRGDFDNFFGPSYTMTTQGGTKNQGKNVVASCVLTRGSLPVGWSGQCFAGFGA